MHLPPFQQAPDGYIVIMRRLRQIFWTVLTLAVLFLGVYLGLTTMRWFRTGPGVHFDNTAVVVQQVQTLSDLVTVKYVMEKVVVVVDMKWYGESRVLLLAHGVVKAGIDLKRLKPEDVTISGTNLSLHLPMPQITDAYLDDKLTEVIDHSTGMLRAYDKTLEQTARQNAVDDIARAARQSGILNDAQERARLELALFLRQAGFGQVEFR